MARIIRTIPFTTSSTQEISLYTPPNSTYPQPVIIGVTTAVGSREAGVVVADDPAYSDNTVLTAVYTLVDEGTSYEALTGLGPVVGFVTMLDGTFRIVTG
jgi:hypothetical protein